MKEINFYSRKPIYGFLSNYHRCPLTVETEWGLIEYPTNEHYYQCMKATTKKDHDFILAAPSPNQAKKAGGNLKKLRHSWDEKRPGFMSRGLMAKFKDPHLQIRLLRTGDAVLHEDSPTDMFWGKKGEDMLGKLIMKVRKHYRDFNEKIGITDESICFICGSVATIMRQGLATCSRHKESELEAMIL